MHHADYTIYKNHLCLRSKNQIPDAGYQMLNRKKPTHNNRLPFDPK